MLGHCHAAALARAAPDPVSAAICFDRLRDLRALLHPITRVQDDRVAC